QGLHATVDALVEQWLGAVEVHLARCVETDAAATIGRLTELTASHPFREGLWALLMTALYRSGRQSDALRCFHEARTQLVEEMGIEPGGELRELNQAILQQDPTLDWQPPRSGTQIRDVPAAVRAADPDATRQDEPTPPQPPGDPVGAGMLPHNLPRHLTSFVGRSAERARVADALGRSRLVTLTGSGGCGKTRLAVAVAEDVLPRSPDGVWFVNLAAVTDPVLIARSIAEPLGVETDQAGQLDHVVRRIGDQRLLLVLDNCEHLVEAVAGAAEQLLLRCPELRILATSREEIRIGAELVWRVPALSLPPWHAPVSDDPFLGSEAVQLFVERGRSALQGFDPRGEGLAAVAQICRRLDGIPLAIELAAALVGSLPVVDIAARLDDRFRLLAPGPREGIPRHRTLRAALDWSFDLLDEDSRALFVRLGVFVGDFTLQAAEAVAGAEGGEPLAVVRGLARLVSTSMVGCVAGSDGADRYRMLETVRQYARELLDELDGADEVCWRHARYYAAFAAEAERHVHGAAASEWLARVVSELPNLRAAVAWAMAREDVEIGLRLAGSLQWFFARMALLDEAARWLEEGLRRREELPTDLRLMAVTAASTVAFMRGGFSRTRELGEEGVEIARALDDAHQLAIALIVRGGAAVYEGDRARAEECFAEAQALCARLGDRWGTAWMLTGWAVASRHAGQLDRARRQLEEALTIFRALLDRHGQVLPLVNLALAAQEEDDADDALGYANEAVDIAVELQDRQLQHVSLCVLGRVEQTFGRPSRARDLLVRSIRDFPGAHHQLMVAIALEGLTGLASAAGRHEVAAALLGFTQHMREEGRITLSESRARERDAWLVGAQDGIGADRVTQELARGSRLCLDDAVALAEAATDSFVENIRRPITTPSGLDAKAAPGSVLPR
ncbi:MAG: ATP-binding protein, partial [Acidimicrobiales bacterium]